MECSWWRARDSCRRNTTAQWLNHCIALQRSEFYSPSHLSCPSSTHHCSHYDVEAQTLTTQLQWWCCRALSGVSIVRELSHTQATGMLAGHQTHQVLCFLLPRSSSDLCLHVQITNSSSLQSGKSILREEVTAAQLLWNEDSPFEHVRWSHCNRKLESNHNPFQPWGQVSWRVVKYI